MPARVYYFTAAGGPNSPPFRYRDGIVGAMANLDDTSQTAPQRLAALGAAARAAGIQVENNYFVEVGPVGATPVNQLAAVNSALFFGEGKIIAG